MLAAFTFKALEAYTFTEYLLFYNPTLGWHFFLNLSQDQLW